MRHRVLVGLISVAALGLVAVELRAADRAGPDDHYVTGSVRGEVLPLQQPQVIWKQTATDPTSNPPRSLSLGEPLVVGEVVYFGDALGHIYALTAESGDHVWSNQIEGSISTAPAADETRLYFATTNGFAAVSRDNGERLWEHVIADGAQEATLLPISGRLYGSGYDGFAYGLDCATGETLWKCNLIEDAGDDPPEFDGKNARLGDRPARPRGAACDGKVFVQSVFDRSLVVGIDCTTGKRLWSFKARGWVGSAPTICDGRVYVVSQDKFVYCLDRDTGSELWKFEAPTWLASRPAVHNDSVFVPVHKARLYQLDAATGRQIRLIQPPDEADREGLVYSFPIVTDQAVYYAAGSTGTVFCFDRRNGELLWKLVPSEGSELFTDLATDGRRLFMVSRPSQTGGESALIAIGP